MKRFFTLIMVFSVFTANIFAQKYITEVLEFTPAPGQFINKSPALPTNAEGIIGKHNGLVSLGACGGSIVFRFEDAVQNHPDHPYGIDFIIYGNPSATWSEPGIVWVMKDENGNGLADDTWYQLAGSEYHFSTTMHNYQVTYTNPNQEVAANVPWEDNYGNTGFVESNSFHKQQYYPLEEHYPGTPQEQLTFTGTRIPSQVNPSNPGQVISLPLPFGYADNLPKKSQGIGIPDNPYTPTVEHGGGDGFDISWAVDSEGNYVDLDEIHFIKVQTGAQGQGGWLGEISTEITGAIAVEPDASITGLLDMVHALPLPATIEGFEFNVEALAFHMGRPSNDLRIEWEFELNGQVVTDNTITIDENQKVTFLESGSLVISYWLESVPDVVKSLKTDLVFNKPPTTTFSMGTFANYIRTTPYELDLEDAFAGHISLDGVTFDVLSNSFNDVAHLSVNNNVLQIVLKQNGQTEIAIKATQGAYEAIGSLTIGAYPEINGNFVVTDFEDLALNENSHWSGDDLSGGFQSGLAEFPNYYDPNFYSWYGWAYSNETDASTSGFLNQYSVYTGEAFNPTLSEGGNFGLAYIGIDWMSSTYETIPLAMNFNDGKPHAVEGFYVTNSTYTALSMLEGDSFTKRFGGDSGDDPDYLKLIVWGVLDGFETEKIEFYLADYRNPDNSKDYIIKTWQWVDLSSLGEVDQLMFNMESSDKDQFGTNTPLYFCIDNIHVVPTTATEVQEMSTQQFTLYPNPTSGQFSIALDANEKVQVSIFNISGKEVFRSEDYTPYTPIDISGKPRGYYIVRVTTNQKTFTQPLIVR